MGFKPFDAKVIGKEFSALPAKDATKLRAVMSLFESGITDAVLIKSYGDGLMMIRHLSGVYKGRCLFFEHEGDQVIVTFYKKESQEVPANVLDRSRTRMKAYKENQE